MDKPKNTGQFGKGNPGKPKGATNKVTREFKQTIQMLLETNAENVGRWLTLVAEGDGTESSKPNPAKALELLSGLAEYAAPKLARTEHVGDGGGDIKTSLTVTFK